MAFGDTVLLTGATGHLGWAILRFLLGEGYHVRCAVRKAEDEHTIRARPAVRRLNPGSRLSFIVVPDITTPGAFVAAAEDAAYIIHAASPLPSKSARWITTDDARETFIKPAAAGTLNILDAAEQSGTVRRVVFTSSIAAIVPISQMEGKEQRTRPVLPEDRIPVDQGPYQSEFAAYAASKCRALQVAEGYMKNERPPFDAVYIHPGFVLGANTAATTEKQAMRGTNSMLAALLLGHSQGVYAGLSVHVEDVARVHVEALSPKILGDQSFILGEQVRWTDAIDIAEEEFPELFASRLLTTSGYYQTVSIPIDTSLTTDTFGMGFISFADQVKSVVEHWAKVRQPRGVPSSTASGPQTESLGWESGKIARVKSPMVYRPSPSGGHEPSIPDVHLSLPNGIAGLEEHDYGTAEVLPPATEEETWESIMQRHMIPSEAFSSSGESGGSNWSTASNDTEGITSGSSGDEEGPTNSDDSDAGDDSNRILESVLLCMKAARR
ncbi:NAD(P)-binding protein [Neurospora tetrasperma FGSC 2509]|nr:NAD(P)-binding protein [Neurospora tetrasperma FGSC 2509]